MRTIFIPPRHAGRTQATIERLQIEAATDEDFELAVKDLREKGIALLRDGKRVEAPARKPPVVIFDEIAGGTLPFIEGELFGGRSILGIDPSGRQ